MDCNLNYIIVKCYMFKCHQSLLNCGKLSVKVSFVLCVLCCKGLSSIYDLFATVFMEQIVKT